MPDKWGERTCLLNAEWVLWAHNRAEPRAQAVLNKLAEPGAILHLPARAKTPFSILGCTQMQNAAKLIARIDHGHALMDRFLLSVPLALRPTPQQQNDAYQYLQTQAIETYDDIFQLVNDLHQNSPCQYTFVAEATQRMNQMNESFTAEVNSAILDGITPPK